MFLTNIANFLLYHPQNAAPWRHFRGPHSRFQFQLRFVLLLSHPLSLEIKTLIEDCSNGRSKFNLLVQIETVADTFHRLTGELSTLLDVFPLQELHLNDDVRELVILLRKQCSESIPFVEAEQISCIGVDNMCIIVDVVKRQPLGLPTEEKISNAMGEVGPSITLASLSETLAFAVGSFVSMPACRVFSMIAGNRQERDGLLTRYMKVRVKNLKLVGSDGWNLMREGEPKKQKQYAALVWISRPLKDEDFQCVSSLKDLVIAATVASDPEKYTEAFLGKPNAEYCNWILDSEKWGGDHQHDDVGDEA